MKNQFSQNNIQINKLITNNTVSLPSKSIIYFLTCYYKMFPVSYSLQFFQLSSHLSKKIKQVESKKKIYKRSEGNIYM